MYTTSADAAHALRLWMLRSSARYASASRSPAYLSLSTSPRSRETIARDGRDFRSPASARRPASCTSIVSYGLVALYFRQTDTAPFGNLLETEPMPNALSRSWSSGVRRRWTGRRSCSDGTAALSPHGARRATGDPRHPGKICTSSGTGMAQFRPCQPGDEESAGSAPRASSPTSGTRSPPR